MAENTTAYRVLARKYRPHDFDALIGQDALVRTLRNAIDSNRIAHAFMLTGVRGVGKTTTARIIARALNYTGADGLSGPTSGPTDDCAVCRSIAEGSHPDVIEMDAASQSKVENIRDLLDGVRYAPSAARYKIYIIDEVHMLSTSAFNALLKTLEEPPAHVKFIFATTEIRKVPVTVLSRCQRFDLRRVEIPVLEAHYKSICDQENVAVEDAALAMIARAADGSVRDGLSLLDQAMAMGAGGITADQVQNMLGLADRGRVLDLLEYTLKGDVAEALALMGDLHRLGADPVVIMNDLLDLTHLLTRLRVAPKTVDLQSGLSPEGMARALDVSGRLSMPSLGRAWQILLKGLAEVHAAPNSMAAAEMVLIRLIYAADLPDPADLLKRLKDQGDVRAHGDVNTHGHPARTPEPVGLRAVAGGAQVATVASAVPVQMPQANIVLADLRDVVAFLEQNREMMWATQLRQYAHLVKFQEGRIEMRVDENAHPKLAPEIGRLLTHLSGQRWVVSVSGASGEDSIAQQDQAVLNARLDQVRANPVVAEVLALFPGATLDIKPKENEKE